jgi:hypothetical protein
MSILFSGDFHAAADYELPLITQETLIKKYGQTQYDTIKYHIILGDGGFLWPGGEENEFINYWALSKRPFPILCVMGNHDPVLGRSDLPEIDIGIDEKVIVVNKEKPFVAYLKRGRVYTIESSKFLVLGGALSIDKEFRQPNKSWWKQEYWSETEENNLFHMLKKNNCFDYVLSHTGPSRINETLNPIRRVGLMPVFFDEVAALNERIDCKITCKQWFCGHWHKDKYYYDPNLQRSYQYLYRTTALLRGDEIIPPLSGDNKE